MVGEKIPFNIKISHYVTHLLAVIRGKLLGLKMLRIKNLFHLLKIHLLKILFLFSISQGSAHESNQ
jgi:hypothetical protein